MTTDELIECLKNAGFKVSESVEQIVAEKGGINLNFSKSISPDSNWAKAFSLLTSYYQTPLNERESEKKYRLRWIDSNDGRDDEFIGPETYLGRSEDNGVLYWTTFQKFGAEIFTESELEQLKKDNPRLAPAIEAMKEEVKDDEEQD